MTEEKMRLDKWLWHARFVKTRSLAQTLLTGGKVRVNGEKQDKASVKVRVGYELAFLAHERLYSIRVLKLSERRGPASDAQLLYEEIEPVENLSTRRGNGQRKTGEGRPSKRDRRQIAQFKKKLGADLP